MKTVTHKGKEYQIGKLYLFGDKEGEGYYYGILKNIDEILNYSFISGEDTWMFCDEVSSNLVGTIKEVPIELEDGERYEFNYCEDRVMAYYSEEHEAFGGCMADYDRYKINHVSNVVKLAPEVK